MWECSRQLTSYMERTASIRAEMSNGCKIVELGAGCGLVGIFCATAGAEVVSTDQPSICNLIQRNAEANLTEVELNRFRTTSLMWGEATTGIFSPDIIVASDVIIHLVSLRGAILQRQWRCCRVKGRLSSCSPMNRGEMMSCSHDDRLLNSFWVVRGLWITGAFLWTVIPRNLPHFEIRRVTGS